MYEHLDDVYRNAARYCVLFISKSYAKRLWTTHERKSAQARAFKENREYILPARFDTTPLRGLLPTVGYLDLSNLSPKRLSELIVDKVGIPRREYYVPPMPDRLFALMNLKGARARGYAIEQAEEFVAALQRMSEVEKKLVAFMFVYGCPTDLPSNIHITGDFLRRITSMPVSECIRELTKLGSLGFQTKLSGKKHNRNEVTIELSFWMRRVGYDGPEDTTGTVDAMIRCLTNDYCPDCVIEAITKGDFSALASATKRPERHVKKTTSVRRPRRR